MARLILLNALFILFAPEIWEGYHSTHYALQACAHIVPSLTSKALNRSSNYKWAVLFSNGNLATDYLPCIDISGEAQSWCCHLSDSVCTQNGYCVGSNGLFYRGGCTDSTFTSPSCPQVCKNAFPTTFSAFFNCADPGTYSQTWCCATGSSDSYCNAGFSIDFGNHFQPNDTQTVTIAASSATFPPSTASSSTISSTPTSSAGPLQTASSSTSRNTNGKIIGVGVGVGLGVGLVAIAVVLFTFLTQQRRRRDAQKTLHKKTKELDTRKQLYEQQTLRQEQPLKHQVEEMDGMAAKNRSELAVGGTSNELDQS